MIIVLDSILERDVKLNIMLAKSNSMEGISNTYKSTVRGRLTHRQFRPGGPTSESTSATYSP